MSHEIWADVCSMPTPSSWESACMGVRPSDMERPETSPPVIRVTSSARVWFWTKMVASTTTLPEVT